MTRIPTPHSPLPIETAQRKTGKVHGDLQVAEAELDLAHEALERQLPPETQQGDVAWALDQSEAVGRKIGQAAEELAEVSELLEEEKAERERLERELRDGRLH
ncbi:MAG TPA: hypothetical protein VHA82_03745 [Ramlibacter sp.]|uniref:hypothetical protein n=1 Tax=Ramlibacter sp. TaxID=1917967 RepID=UPI002C22F744|nr:hypothetical protein [Ramlibacter sp.]HVZ42902.1 hypothetical protein [Ramlibacter sp.]